ncbi:MAG: hypothetical protein IPK72_21595 [Candidatus Eisenbacteria bacterium]|nr:hypothetical protein [Candidatus Eisenbacteria bacterium]
MQSFEFRLHLDAPLLLGGVQAGAVDPGGMLRGPSVRGLMRTFARAWLGPMLKFDPKATREAERRLLGAAGGSGDGGEPTLRVVDISSGPMDRGSAQVLPHGKLIKGRMRFGDREAFSAGQARRLRFTVRAAAAAREPLLADALLAVAWSAFALGSLGNRCRRGFGSMSIVGIDRRGRAADGPVWLPPDFGPAAARDAGAVRSTLDQGLSEARGRIHAWLQKSGSTHGSASDEYFFGIGSDGSDTAKVHIGDLHRSWESFLATLMKSCHSSLSLHPSAHEGVFGGVNPRRASPVWIRVYSVREGLVPVATCPARWPPNASPLQPLQATLGAVGFDPSRHPAIPIA